MAHPLRALALLALLIASFARLPAAEATMPAGAPMASSGHCSDMPAPSPGKPAPMSIDCMIACAAIAPPACATLPAAAPQPAMIEPVTPTRIIGIHSATDPPPPRLS